MLMVWKSCDNGSVAVMPIVFLYFIVFVFGWLYFWVGSLPPVVKFIWLGLFRFMGRLER